MMNKHNCVIEFPLFDIAAGYRERVKVFGFAHHYHAAVVVLI